MNAETCPQCGKPNGLGGFALEQARTIGIKTSELLCRPCWAQRKGDILRTAQQNAVADAQRWQRFVKHEISRDELLAGVTERDHYRRLADRLEQQPRWQAMHAVTRKQRLKAVKFELAVFGTPPPEELKR